MQTNPSDANTGHLGDEDDFKKKIQTIRTRVVDRLLYTFIILGALALFASFLRALDHGWRPVMFFHMGIYLVILGTVLFKKHLSPYFMPVFLLAAVFTIGVVSCLAYGLASVGLLILSTLCVLATIFFGTRAGVIAVLSCLGIIGITGIGVFTNLISFHFDLSLAPVIPFL